MQADWLWGISVSWSACVAIRHWQSNLYGFSGWLSRYLNRSCAQPIPHRSLRRRPPRTPRAMSTTIEAVVSGRRRLMLEIVHGEVIDAARADLWASSLGQVGTRSSARTQNPRHQVG